MYLKRFEFVCAAILCGFCVNAISLDNSKQTLSVDNPISGTPEQRKDLKRDDSNFRDPPPEFYRGPTSATMTRDRNRYGFQTGDTAEHRYDTMSSTNAVPYGSSGYGSPSRWSSSGYRDRISVGGYYGNSNTGYGYDRPRGPYGPASSVDLPGGYNSYGSDYGQSGYGGNGHDMWSEKWNQLSKSNIIPIASAALLGVAAAFILNPTLLPLGTMSVGKRRKRDTSAHNLAYKGQRK